MVAKKSTPIMLALIVDSILISVFAAVGHWSHTHELTVDGFLMTAWPFWVGLVLAWLLTLGWEKPLAPLRTGVGIWATTLLLALVLRSLTGAGTAGTFIAVAAAFTFATIVGWRIIASVAAAAPRTRRKS